MQVPAALAPNPTPIQMEDHQQEIQSPAAPASTQEIEHQGPGSQSAKSSSIPAASRLMKVWSCYIRQRWYGEKECLRKSWWLLYARWSNTAPRNPSGNDYRSWGGRPWRYLLEVRRVVVWNYPSKNRGVISFHSPLKERRSPKLFRINIYM